MHIPVLYVAYAVPCRSDTHGGTEGPFQSHLQISIFQTERGMHGYCTVLDLCTRKSEGEMGKGPDDEANNMCTESKSQSWLPAVTTHTYGEQIIQLWQIPG